MSTCACLSPTRKCGLRVHPPPHRVCIHLLNLSSDGAVDAADPATPGAQQEGSELGDGGRGWGGSRSTGSDAVAEGYQDEGMQGMQGMQGSGLSRGGRACVPAQGLFTKALEFDRNGSVVVASVCP